LRLNARQLTALKGYIRDMVPRYPDLAMPVELLHGDADTIVGLDLHSRALATQLPQARLTVLPGIGHMPHHAAQADLVAAVERVAARA
jgi:pimeloyl-ACP methyl ester carboxylesterase